MSTPHRYRIAGALILAAAVLTAPAPAHADEEQGAYAWVRSARWGRRYFKMLPDKGSPYDHAKGTGIAYEVQPVGPDKELWRVTGWYAFEAWLSQDGRSLVRLGNWPRGHEPKDEHLGIAFYRDGKLLRRYSTRDLIKDRTKVQPSVSHYQYKRSVPGFERSDTRFTLVSIDGVTWTFDVTTGAVLSPAP